MLSFSKKYYDSFCTLKAAVLYIQYEYNNKPRKGKQIKHHTKEQKSKSYSRSISISISLPVDGPLCNFFHILFWLHVIIHKYIYIYIYIHISFPEKLMSKGACMFTARIVTRKQKRKYIYIHSCSFAEPSFSCWQYIFSNPACTVQR